MLLAKVTVGSSNQNATILVPEPSCDRLKIDSRFDRI